MTTEYPEEFLLRNQPDLDRMVTRRRFCGHSVVVTGGASGIGLATVERFLNDGADHVAIFDFNKLRGVAAVEDIVKHQGVTEERIAFFELDVRDSAAVQSACEAFAKRCGGQVTCFVHCAALFTSLSSSATTSQFEQAFEVNVLGAVSAVRALRPFMQSAGGAVVLISSTAASIAQRQRWTYAATKGALTALTKEMAIDLAEDGIRVNAVAPGYVWSPVEKAVSPDGSRAAMAYLTAPASCQGRDQLLAEVAAAVTFLCSRDAGAITGTRLAVDGGYTAMGPEGKAPVTKTDATHKS